MNQRSSKPLSKQSAPAATSRPPVARPASAASATGIPPLLWVALGALMIGMLAIILAMTPYTYNLDDIKVLLLMVCGPMLTLLGLGLLYVKAAAPPPRVIVWGLLGFGVVMLLSTLVAEYRWQTEYHVPFWTAWYQLKFVWAVAGFFLVASCIGNSMPASRLFLRFLVLQLLIVNLIGFFFYDVTNTPEHRSGVAWLFRTLYPSGQSYSESVMFPLLNTLTEADNIIQSTILNRDFYAGFCVLFLPFAVLLALDPGEGRRMLWRSIGIAAALLTTLSIFFAQSKGEYIFAFISIVFYLGMFLKVGYIPELRRRHLLAWGAGILLIMGLLVWMKSPTLFQQLKSLKTSTDSRSIMWKGAWGIAKRYPVLGSGPGGFRIYFPEFRQPDYFDHEINNVTTYSHNYFLDLLCEEGVLGLACFLVMLGGLFILGLRYALRHPDPRLRLWLSAAIASLIAIYGSNLSSPSGRWVIGAVPLWTVMGFLAGMIRQAQLTMPRDEQREPVRRGAPFRIAGQPIDRVLLPALALIGVVQLCLSIPLGKKYFKSNVDYASGLMYMEWGYREFQTGKTPADDIIGMMQTSAGLFEKAIETDPTDISAYYKLGSVYTTLAQIYDQIATNLLQNGQTQQAETYQAESDKNLDLAREKYETMSTYDPDYAEIHYNLGIIYHNYANKRLLASQKAPTPEAAASLKKESQEMEEKALVHLKRMSKMSVKAEVYTLLGEHYNGLRRWADARDVYRDASSRYPANKDLAMSYYKAASTVDDYAGAGEALWRMWQAAPADDTLLDQILTLAQNHRLDDLLKRIIERLEHINPIHPRLFEARLSLDRHQKAAPAEILATADRYVSSGGQDLECYQQGAEAALALGRADEARRFFERMTNLDRDGKTTYGVQARRRLAELRQGPAATAPAAANAVTSGPGTR